MTPYPAGPLRPVSNDHPPGDDITPATADGGDGAAQTYGGAVFPAAVAVVWTVTDLAAALQCTPSWIYDEVEAGRIPVLRLGRQLRFRPADITDWLDQQHHPARPPTPPLSVRPRHRRRRLPPAGRPSSS